MNNVHEVEACIDSGALFDTAELVGIQKVIGGHMELEPGADHFFDEFVYSIEQDNGSKGFGYVI